MGISLREADQVQFVLLTFAQAAVWIGVGPELAVRDVFQAGNFDSHSQDVGFYATAGKWLVSLIRCELNAKLAAGGEHIQRVGIRLGFESLFLKMVCKLRQTRRNHNDVGVKRVDRLHIAIHCQTADQAVWPE